MITPYKKRHELPKMKKNNIRPQANKSIKLFETKYFNMIEPGLRFGNSFRFNFGPQGQLIKVAADGKSIQIIQQNDQQKEIEELFLDCHLKSLNILINEEEPDSLPKVQVDHQAFINNMQDLINENANRFSNHEIAIWKLLSIILKDCNSEDEIKQHVFNVQQIKELKQWFYIVHNQYSFYYLNENKQIQEPLVQILNSLINKELASACQLAYQNGFSRLATLIAQAGGDCKFKNYLNNQLRIWIDNKSIRNMDRKLIRIYLLLAGNVFTQDLKNNNLLELKNELLDLPWFIKLGLHYWYVEFYDAPLENSLNIFKQHIEDSNNNESNVLPLPYYINNNNLSLNENVGELDGIYQLLNWYSNFKIEFKDLINPKSYHDNGLLNSRLSFYLSNIFLKHFDNNNNLSVINQLNDTLCFQLLSKGLWKYAILISLHISDETIKKKRIMDILINNVELVTETDKYNTFPSENKLDDKELLTDNEKELVYKMGIPISWIHQAKGYKLNYFKYYEYAIQHGLLSNQYNFVYQLCLYRIFPKLLIEENYLLLKDFIYQLELYPTPKNDTYNINVFKLYLEVISFIPNKKVYITNYDNQEFILPSTCFNTNSHIINNQYHLIATKCEALLNKMNKYSPLGYTIPPSINNWEMMVKDPTLFITNQIITSKIKLIQDILNKDKKDVLNGF